ncbi:MAG: T9SS type A sorting domain-containing protein, partial [Bacteroidota bacterium]
FTLSAQPVNNTCATATPISVGATCTYQTFTNLNATDSGDGSPSCGFYTGADVWFSLVVPASGQVLIDQSQDGLTNTAMSVYTGSCGSLTEYECDDDDSPNGSMPQILINDATLANQTIYIQVWRRNSTTGGTFQICAFEPSIPANLNCANATPISVGATCTYQTFTNEYAGDSGDGSPSCGFYFGTDVWFSLSVPASGQVVIDQAQAGLSNTAMSIYTGSCGTLTEYACDSDGSPNGSMPQVVINDLSLANQTIYIQVWRRASVNGGTFQICAFEPSVPSNVDCANATPITVGATCTYQTFTNEYAGDSGDGSPTCGFYFGTDVWFSLTVPASGKLVIDQSQAGLSNTAMSVYTGNCGSLTEYECDSDDSPNGSMPQIVINDLSLANQTLYIQVWRRASVNGGTFQICAFEPVIPDNVDCANATPISVGGTCTYQTFTNEYAGDSGDGGPSCGFYFGTDVWFSLTVPASGKLVIDQLQAGLSNTAMSVYTGSCGSLTEYACDSDGSPNGSMPQIVVNDPALANQTLYVQVWRRAGVNGGTFQICAFEPTIPDNVDCANAETLLLSSDFGYGFFTNEYAGTSGDANPSCAFFFGTDVWFTIQVPVSGKLIIDQIQDGLSNTAMAVYTGSCGALFEYACDDNSSTNGSMPRIDINDLALASQTIYIQVWRRANVNGGTFGITAYDPDNPIFPVEWLDFQASAQEDGSVQLDWITGQELNNDYFSIERSVDARMFTEIGQVAASTKSSATHSYRFFDGDPLRGTTYYRLRQIDFDGSSTYSDVVRVERNADEPLIAFFPNPADDFLQLQLKFPRTSSIQYQLIDQQGRSLLQKSVRLESHIQFETSIAVDKLAAGLYQLVVRDLQQDKVYHHKVLIH